MWRNWEDAAYIIAIAAAIAAVVVSLSPCTCKVKTKPMPAIIPVLYLTGGVERLH